MKNTIAALVTMQADPFPGEPEPTDMLVRVVEFNENGLEIVVFSGGVEATPNECGLAQYMISRLGYTNTALKVGQEFHLRPSLIVGTAAPF